MLLIDLFYYTIYRFLRRIGRNKENAKFGTLSLLAACVFFSTITIFYIIGLIKDNSLSRSLLDINTYMLISVIIGGGYILSLG